MCSSSAIAMVSLRHVQHRLIFSACSHVNIFQASFNFQTNNFGKGGMDNDPVQVSVQNSAGLDGADFATLPE